MSRPVRYAITDLKATAPSAAAPPRGARRARPRARRSRPRASRSSAIHGSMRTTRWTGTPASRSSSARGDDRQREALVDDEALDAARRARAPAGSRSASARRRSRRAAATASFVGSQPRCCAQARQQRERERRARGRLPQHVGVRRRIAAGGQHAHAEHRHALGEALGRRGQQLGACASRAGGCRSRARLRGRS